MLYAKIKPDEDKIVEKPKPKAVRIKKSIAARIRRKEIKQIKQMQLIKEEKEAKNKLKNNN